MKYLKTERNSEPSSLKCTKIWNRSTSKPEDLSAILAAMMKCSAEEVRGLRRAASKRCCGGRNVCRLLCSISSKPAAPLLSEAAISPQGSLNYTISLLY